MSPPPPPHVADAYVLRLQRWVCQSLKYTRWEVSPRVLIKPRHTPLNPTWCEEVTLYKRG